jgi:hypothetical protein
LLCDPTGGPPVTAVLVKGPPAVGPTGMAVLPLAGVITVGSPLPDVHVITAALSVPPPPTEFLPPHTCRAGTAEAKPRGRFDRLSVNGSQ